MMVDVSALERLASGSIVGPIWVEGAEEPFPELEWMDFPVVVLGWWTEAVLSSESRGGAAGSIELSFMDGPWEIILDFDGERCIANLFRARSANSGRLIEISYDVFFESVKECALRVIEECDLKGWESVDIDSLRRMLNRMKGV
ncbi:hypothetical protein [Streptosporangium saharense]|uniref:Uncharacterized protein n=1 Tax=Streptosporangium saharense TaxID=1706840 RepID=A0A7W7VMY8_9ACTN|nr:hypothetical protein [Streptosporangium saharense]MBB4916123.1 hypothetical protein [Streptosporangium saharense]